MIETEMDTKKITDIIVKLEKNILIYPHLPFSNNDGGMSVQYYLAHTLSKLNLGVNIQIYNVHDNNSLNSIYNDFVNDIQNINFDNTIVIYCEGVVGNPLNAKYVVRWMLSKLGQNVPCEHYYSWGQNELVYFFNSEKDMVNKNIQFKLLSLFYFDSEIKNNNYDLRKGLCYTTRKKNHFNQNIDINIVNNTFTKYNNIMNLPKFEITRSHTQSDYIDIFNKHTFFISYDPLTFLNIIAILCGCVSIVFPIDGVSKIEYFKMTPFYQYMVEKNCFEIYGLAYGMSYDEITYSKNTLHLAKQQMTDIQNWFIDKYVKQFIVDINNWDKNTNTLKYYRYSMCETIELFDVNFYKSIHKDLSNMSNEEATNHYHYYGKNEGRLTSEKHFYKLYPQFDIQFYKNNYSDLKNMSNKQLFNQYHYYGKYENRDFYKNIFNVELYRLFNDDLKNMSDEELLIHYRMYGKNERRIISINDFYKFYTDFDIDFYRSSHTNFENISDTQLLSYYHNKKNYKSERLIDINIYNKYKNNIDYKEKIYLNNLNVTNIVEKLENNNTNILIYNGDYNESSGGITVLHYFCHLLNYTAKKNIAYLVKHCGKNINNYNNNDYILKTNPNYLTPCVTPEILLNRNNIVIYMDSIVGNPLEQKYVVRWVLYFELAMRIKSWDKNDLIIWFIDTYQKHSKYIQKVNNEESINYQEIPNKQIIMPIVSNIDKILAFGENNENNIKNGICFTTRKSGDNINQDRRIRKIDIIGERCKNCQKNIWPCICNCENYTNGVKLLHSKENIVYRFEYPINLNDEIAIFAKTEQFYMYDPFCFSAVLAGLKNCLTIVPKLDSFEDDNPYENVPWMKYGISYGTDEESIMEAKKTLPFTKEKLTEVFFGLNYNSLEIFFNAINELF
jgi:hypothetical protein